MNILILLMLASHRIRGLLLWNMLDESQRKEITQRLTTELDLENATEEESKDIEGLVFGLSLLPSGHDTEFLIDKFDPERKDHIVQRAAQICLDVFLKHS